MSQEQAGDLFVKAKALIAQIAIDDAGTLVGGQWLGGGGGLLSRDTLMLADAVRRLLHAIEHQVATPEVAP